MEDDTGSNVPFDRATAEKLVEKGALSKEFLDRVYSDLNAQHAQDLDQSKTKAASEVAALVATDPHAADVAARADAMLKNAPPPAAALPPPSAAPAPTPGASAAAAPDPTATPTPTGEPTPDVPQPMGGASGSWNDAPAPARVDPNNITSVTAAAAKSAADRGSPEDVLANLNNGFELQKHAILDNATAAAVSSAEKAKLLGGAANDLQKLAENNRDRMQQYEDMRDAEIKKQIDAVDHFNTLTIDPGRYWGSLSTPQRITAGIATALSAFGGGHQAYDVIQSSIDKDISLQKSQADLAMKGVEMRQNLITQMRGVTNDEASAEHLARAAILDQVKLRVEQVSAMAQGPQAKQNAAALVAQIDLQKAELMSQIAKAAKPPSLSNAGSPVIDPKEMDKWIPGYGVATSKEGATLLREQIPKLEQAKEYLGDLVTYTQKYGELGKIPDTEAAAASMKSQLLMTQLREGFFGKRFNEMDFKFLQRVIDDPSAITKLAPYQLARLKVLQDYAVGSINSNLQINGIEPKYKAQILRKQVPNISDSAQ